MILEKIEKIQDFTDTEQQILTWLLQHPEDVLVLSVRDLAKRTYTSASTVNRLAAKLTDGQGFTQFKAALFRELHQPAASAPRDPDNISSHETVYSVAAKVAASEKEAVEQTFRSLDYAALNRAAWLLQKADQICFFGFDDNLSLAKPHLYRMMTYGKQVILHEASNAQYYQALTIPEQPADSCRCVALFISRTGENRRLVDIATILKDKHIPVLLITPLRDSSLSKIADELLTFPLDYMNAARGSIMMDAAIQYILNVLCALMFSDNYEASRKILRQYGMMYRASQGETLPPETGEPVPGGGFHH